MGGDLMSSDRDPSNQLLDLFVSYSHIDDRPWGPAQHRWVNQFHKELESRLEMLLGRRIEIWRDPKLRGNDELSEAITDALARSTTFLLILSPRYLKSEWCVKEFEFFKTTTSGRHLPGTGRPWFKV